MRKEGIEKYFAVMEAKNEPRKEKPFSGNLKVHVGRLIYRHKAPEGVFKLLKWDNKGRDFSINLIAKEGTVRRITDNYKIPLDTKKYTKQDYFFLHELNDAFFLIGSKEEEAAVLAGLNSNRIKIKYKVRTETAPPATYCETVSVEPDNIPIQDVYDFRQTLVLY